MTPWRDENGNPWDPRDTAAVCENGHLINGLARSDPVRTTAFCTRCGAGVITACPVCDTRIPGALVLDDGYGAVGGHPARVEAYCGACGSPFPWTTRTLAAVTEALDLDLTLSADRAAVTRSLPDLTRETPLTPVAASRVRAVLGKMQPAAVAVFRDVIGPVLVELGKRHLG